MLDHPALNWLRQHPRLFALIGSLLIAGYVLSLGERPNDDAYTYVRVADILLHDGLAAAYAMSRVLRLADGPDEVHRQQLAKMELRKYQ